MPLAAMPTRKQNRCLSDAPRVLLLNCREQAVTLKTPPGKAEMSVIAMFRQ